MLGAIIGDIVGSRFEFNNYKSKDFELFTNDCFVTDDTIMTLAIAKAILTSEENRENLGVQSVKLMQEIGRKYPDCGYGGRFYKWIFCDEPKQYDSFGNGSAMRVSPAGFAANSEWEAEELAGIVTEVTHNHEEGIKGAKATAVAIYMARQGATKSEIRKRVENYYILDFRIDDIRPSYKFNETCQDTVPQAITCFLEAVSFEDTIRTAISLGGDSDTIAAIAGAIAEAYYGVPDEIRRKALEYLNADLLEIYDEWTTVYPPNNEKFRVLTKYIGKLSDTSALGEWIIDNENDGTPEHPIHMPWVNYNDLVMEFIHEFYQYSETHPEYELNRYPDILEKNGIKNDLGALQSQVFDQLNEQCILAIIMSVIRADRFCEGALLEFLEDRSCEYLLKRLKDIDLHGKKNA